MDDPIGEKSLEVMSEAGWYNDWTFDLIKKNLGESVLEIGSGIGNFTSMIAKKAKTVYATDIRPQYIKKLKIRKRKNIKVMYGDIEKNKFSGSVKNVDSIVCLNVLEHIKNDNAALKNMNKKLKKGGKLNLLVPSHMAFYGTLDRNLGHYRRYNKKDLTRKLKKAGFKVNDIRYINPIAGLGWFVNARILKKEAVSSGNIKIFTLIVKPVIFLEKYIRFPFGLSVYAVAEK